MHENPLDEKAANVKLFKTNDLVNLRLTKQRDDIKELLNQKKLQGIDISEYLSGLIRRAEGLEPALPAASASSQPAPLEITGSLIDELVNRMLDELMRRGITLGGATGIPDQTPDKHDAVAEAKKQQLKQIAADLTDWGDG